MMFTVVLSFLKCCTHTDDVASEKKHVLKGFCFMINIQLINNQPIKCKYECKIKVIFILEQSMKTQRGSRSIAVLFLQPRR